MFKYLAVLTLIFTLVSLAPVTTFAQTKQEKKAAKIKDKIQKFGTGEKANVKVKTYAGLTFQGYVNSSAADDFVVVDKAGESHTVRYSDVDKIGGKNLSTGAKIAIGIGIGAGLTLLVLYLILTELGKNS